MEISSKLNDPLKHYTVHDRSSKLAYPFSNVYKEKILFGLKHNTTSNVSDIIEQKSVFVRNSFLYFSGKLFVTVPM